MTIHSICGLQNSGKTEYMVFLGFMDFLRGRTILTNHHVTYAHKRINKDFLFYLGEHQPILRNITFLLDELWLWLDCRKSMENTIATYFFLQSSKDNSNIFLTAQDNSQNEIRIQKNLHRYSECERVLKYNNKYIPCPIDERDLSGYFTKEGVCLNDILYLKIQNYKRNLDIRIQQDFIANKKILYLKAQPYFKLFNTYEKKIIV